MPDTTIPPSLPAAFVRAASAHPEKPLLHFEGSSYTYHQLHKAISRVAGHLRAWGLGKGDRVALYLENSPSFITAYLAVQWLGAVIVPVNTRYRETELRHMLSDSGARLMVSDQAGRAAVDKVRAEVGALEALVTLTGDLARDLDEWQALAEGEAHREPVALGHSDLAVIGYTSGTTGRSKGAMLSHGNFLTNSAALTKAWGWTKDDHLLLVLPLFHMHGLGVGFHGTLVQGSSITLKRKFDSAEVMRELAEGQITMFFGVPTMYSRLLAEAKLSGVKPKGLRLLVSGSAPLSPQLHGDIKQLFGLKILERYGMTETVMNTGNPLEGERKPGSVGVPFEGVHARIADPETETPLDTGEIGEIQLQGPNICRGYWQNPEATREVWTQDGWFKTGDLGYQDEGGYFYITGRAKELIISGGFNIYPREVEEVLEAHPKVQEAGVVGLPDEDLGEKVVAAIVGEVELEALQDFCRARLAGFKKPRELYPVEALPRNALGKVQKHILREQLLKGSG